MSASFNLSSPNNISVTDYFTMCDDQRIGFWFWCGFSVASFLLGFPASLILVMELLHRQRQKATNDIFMFNLTVMDLTFTGIMPISVCNYTIWYNPTFEYFMNLIYTLAMWSRPLFMACVCVDCYFAVVHPITYKTNKTSSIIRKEASVTVWLISASFSLYMAFTPWGFTSPLSSMTFIAMLPVITFCDVSILRSLRKPDPSANNSIHPQKKRAFHAIVNSFVMTFVVYLPPSVIFLFGVMMPMTKLNYICILAMLGLCFSMAGCIIMPIVNLASLGKLAFLKEWLNKIFLVVTVTFSEHLNTSQKTGTLFNITLVYPSLPLYFSQRLIFYRKIIFK